MAHPLLFPKRASHLFQTHTQRPHLSFSKLFYLHENTCNMNDSRQTYTHTHTHTHTLEPLYLSQLNMKLVFCCCCKFWSNSSKHRCQLCSAVYQYLCAWCKLFIWVCLPPPFWLRSLSSFWVVVTKIRGWLWGSGWTWWTTRPLQWHSPPPE